jgi:hypothetical protein
MTAPLNVASPARWTIRRGFDKPKPASEKFARTEAAQSLRRNESAFRSGRWLAKSPRSLPELLKLHV